VLALDLRERARSRGRPVDAALWLQQSQRRTCRGHDRPFDHVLKFTHVTPQRDLSDVVILDAQDFTGEPTATIRLPVRVPHGFHGGWAPDKITVVE